MIPFEDVLALPRESLLAILETMSLPTLTMFRRKYSFGERSNGDVGVIPFEAHAIILTRLDPERYGDFAPKRRKTSAKRAQRQRQPEHYRKTAKK